jgi:hypothetical protein
LEHAGVLTNPIMDVDRFDDKRYVTKPAEGQIKNLRNFGLTVARVDGEVLMGQLVIDLTLDSLDSDVVGGPNAYLDLELASTGGGRGQAQIRARWFDNRHARGRRIR